MLSAIIIVGPEIRKEEPDRAPTSEVSTTFSSVATQVGRGIPLVCLEVLGRSVVERMIDELRGAGAELISILGVASDDQEWAGMGWEIGACSSEQAWSEVTQRLLSYKEEGVDATLVVRLGAYADWDLKGALHFHRERGQAVTQAFEENGAPLDLWIIDPRGITQEADVLRALRTVEPFRYQARGYVNRLESYRDLRRLIVDALTSRCGLRPLGSEIRPGIWMAEGAEVHRDARIVAPAFIGRGAKISEQCLITRCSNVESNCQVDYGTVVEDSSILSNTYVGIGLDISHALVDGNNLLNLERGVTLEIADPCVISQITVTRPERTNQFPVGFGFGGMQ